MMGKHCVSDLSCCRDKTNLLKGRFALAHSTVLCGSEGLAARAGGSRSHDATVGNWGGSKATAQLILLLSIFFI